MNAEVTPDEDQRRACARRGLCRREGRSAGRPRGGGAAGSRIPTLSTATGLPHRRVEEWKYTDLRALMRDAKPLAPPPDAAAKSTRQGAGQLLGDVEARRIVFVDGVFVPELSDLAALEPGCRIGSLARGAGDGRCR